MTLIRPKVDSSLLIDQVKQHACLYDNRAGHGNHELKNAAWGEIGQAMFGDAWYEFSSADKDSIVKEMQVKWKSLRDNFSRQLRLQAQAKAGTRPASMKKYVYMDRLSFLYPFISKREKVMLSEDSKDSNDSQLMPEDTKPVSMLNSAIDPIDISSPPPLHFVPIQPKSFTTATLTPIDFNSLNNTSISNYTDQEPPAKKVAKCLEELVHMQKEEKSDDPMGNKKFLLSLLPFMKKLPDDVNLEVRLQLMSVLETYTSGKSQN